VLRAVYKILDALLLMREFCHEPVFFIPEISQQRLNLCLELPRTGLVMRPIHYLAPDSEGFPPVTVFVRDVNKTHGALMSKPPYAAKNTGRLISVNDSDHKNEIAFNIH
jgi:hypothetical protein